MVTKQRVGVYGGTFDPIHRGHLAIAHSLLHLFALDRILFVPALVAPHKRAAKVTSAIHRYAMIALATQTDDRLMLSTIELEAPERPFTFDTLAKLGEDFGDGVDLYFVMGADSWNEITSWRNWENLLRLSNHIVVTRPEFDWRTEHVPQEIRNRIVDLRGSDETKVEGAAGQDGGSKIFITDAVFMDVSATEVRRAVSQGRFHDVEKLVPPPVGKYIRKYGLYTNEYGREFDN
jgi:nicotinate-nucleotide adenylyltransferase